MMNKQRGYVVFLVMFNLNPRSDYLHLGALDTRGQHWLLCSFRTISLIRKVTS